MDDSNNSPPPPIPVRPGRAVQICSIDTLKQESKPNDYVETNTISGVALKPKLPPKLQKLDKTSSLGTKHNTAKDIEQRENVTNELREHLQDRCNLQSRSPTVNDSQSPEIPPRSSRPPPVPPRECKNILLSRSLTAPKVIEQPARWCNSTIERRQNATFQATANSNKLQPKVLIITEQPRFPQFPTSRLTRHDKNKDIGLSSIQPVTQQPRTSNVTLSLGETGAVSNTIICPECGQCRCSDCTGDRKLPERWLCEGNCRCSADSVVDTLSCMCCVKSCFNGCIDNPDGSRVKPCSCFDKPNCLLRWTALTAISIFLPCLCCYCPMQLGVAAATGCYNSSCCRKRGCNCEKD